MGSSSARPPPLCAPSAPSPLLLPARAACSSCWCSQLDPICFDRILTARRQQLRLMPPRTRRGDGGAPTPPNTHLGHGAGGGTAAGMAHGGALQHHGKALTRSHPWVGQRGAGNGAGQTATGQDRRPRCPGQTPVATRGTVAPPGLGRGPAAPAPLPRSEQPPGWPGPPARS